MDFSSYRVRFSLKNLIVPFIFIGSYFDIDVDKVKEQEMLAKLQKNNISIHTLNLPVIDDKGAIILNKGNLKEFLKVLEKKIIKNEK
jgi:hypothetical protein